MQINATEIAGIVAFLPAALLAGANSSLHRRAVSRLHNYWGAISGLNLLLSADMVFEFRYRLYLAIVGWVKSDSLYDGRRPVQAALIVVTLLVGFAVMLAVVAKASTRLQAMASAMTASALLLYAVETVSLHAVDAVLYESWGPVQLVGWLWLVCGLTTSVAAFAERQNLLRLTGSRRI